MAFCNTTAPSDELLFLASAFIRLGMALARAALVWTGEAPDCCPVIPAAESSKF